MALLQGDKVAPTVLTFTGAPFPNVQGPMFGVVDNAAAPWDVLWNDGKFALDLTGTSLDKITPAADATLEALVGRRVKVTLPAGQNNWGIMICVACYTRQANGAGSTVEMALLRNPAGYFLEVTSANCEAIPG